MNELIAPVAAGLPQSVSTILIVALMTWCWRIDRRLAILIAELKAARLAVTGIELNP